MTTLAEFSDADLKRELARRHQYADVLIGLAQSADYLLTRELTIPEHTKIWMRGIVAMVDEAYGVTGTDRRRERALLERAALEP